MNKKGAATRGGFYGARRYLLTKPQLTPTSEDDPLRTQAVLFCVTHTTAAHSRLPSVVSNVDIAEDARFKFQIIQPVLNHVAYADDASQLAGVKHGHVAYAMAGHQAH